MRFLYRVDPVSNLRAIASSGLKCGLAGRLNYLTGSMGSGMPWETAEAARQRWRIPPVSLIQAPRLYVWLDEKMTHPQMVSVRDAPFSEAAPGNHEYRAIRFPACLFSEGDVYPDGCFGPNEAAYIIFPFATASDVIVSAGVIEVRLGREWVSIQSFVST